MGGRSWHDLRARAGREQLMLDGKDPSILIMMTHS